MPATFLLITGCYQNMLSRQRMRLITFPALISALLISGCASDGPLLRNPFASNQERQIEKLGADELYASARASLDSGDADSALDFYRRLDANYPFTRYATQGQLETIYAHYRAFQPEQALSSASRFIKQHPRHPEIDYIYYLRGVIYQESIEQNLETLLMLDSTERSPESARQAFEAFALLIQRYPASAYAPEARERMIWLKERIARNELYVAEYYLRRKAYVASSRRAQEVLKKYQGTRAIPRALIVIRESYAGLGMKDLAKDAQAVLDFNYPGFDPEAEEEGWDLWPFNDDDDEKGSTQPPGKLNS